MIVIPCFNGKDTLAELLSGLSEFGTYGHDVTVVNTHSQDPNTLAYFEEIKNQQFPFQLEVITALPNSGYETTAIVSAYRHKRANSYLLLQDSIKILSHNWLSVFESKLIEHDVVTWMRFQPCLCFCSQSHLDYIKRVTQGLPEPPDGVFGNIFMCRAEVLDKLDSMGYFNELPKDKMGSESWERIWGYLFYHHEFSSTSVYHTLDFYQIANFDPHMRKKFMGRA